MKEIPILFNAEMVRAILEGKKTQTRRPVKLPGIWNIDVRDGKNWPGYEDENGDWQWAVSPFGNVGDHLWVRETFAGYIQMSHEYDEWREATTEEIKERYPMTIEYRATSKSSPEKWRPSIHMPRWASRITLKVTDIRVQRVQEISEEDAEQEGIKIINEGTPFACCWDYLDNESRSPSFFHPSDSFFTLWQSIYGTWDANPWVWSATFEVVKRSSHFRSMTTTNVRTVTEKRSTTIRPTKKNRLRLAAKSVLRRFE